MAKTLSVIGDRQYDCSHLIKRVLGNVCLSFNLDDSYFDDKGTTSRAVVIKKVIKLDVAELQELHTSPIKDSESTHAIDAVA